MKIRFGIFLAALVLAAALVGARGAELKYKILPALGMPGYEDKSIFELAFLEHTDDVLIFMLENAEELMNPPTLPPVTRPPISQPGTSVVVPPVSSVPEVTLPSASGESQPVETLPPQTQPPVTEPPVTLPPATQPLPGNEPNFDFPGTAVDDSWFDNVLFIGNSRTCGLRGNARSGKADYFCDYGMTVFNYQEKVLSDKSFKNMSLGELLSSRQYDKIFINFGLNESGYYFRNFELAYQKMYLYIRQAQPNAKIILHSIIGVTRDKYSQGDYYHFSNLSRMNGVMQALANGVDTFYIDPNPYFVDAEGFLFDSMTNDGYHLSAPMCLKWREFIHKSVGLLGI